MSWFVIRSLRTSSLGISFASLFFVLLLILAGLGHRAPFVKYQGLLDDTSSYSTASKTSCSFSISPTSSTTGLLSTVGRDGTCSTFEGGF